MNTEKLRGIAVVSRDEGAKLGQVDQARFDPVNLDLRALRVKGDGQTFLVPFDRVAAFGADAVMVESSQVTQAQATGGALDQLVPLDTLKQLKVVDAAGTLLGTVRPRRRLPASLHPWGGWRRASGRRRVAGHSAPRLAAELAARSSSTPPCCLCRRCRREARHAGDATQAAQSRDSPASYRWSASG